MRKLIGARFLETGSRLFIYSLTNPNLIRLRHSENSPSCEEAGLRFGGQVLRLGPWPIVHAHARQQHARVRSIDFSAQEKTSLVPNKQPLPTGDTRSDESEARVESGTSSRARQHHSSAI